MVELTQCRRRGPWKPIFLCLLAWGLPEAEEDLSPRTVAGSRLGGWRVERNEARLT